MKISVSNVCKAFEDRCVGTKVISKGDFWIRLEEAVASYEFPTNGQGFIVSPKLAETVSSGDCSREGLEEGDYIIREWRGEMMMFAKRLRPTPSPGASFCAVVVYTLAAYLADPEITPEEAERVKGSDYVLVAVLGSYGPKPTLSSHRFVRNLAGGNAAFVPTMDREADLDLLVRLIGTAVEIVKYERDWITVAD
jgi:hypothetical protein